MKQFTVQIQSKPNKIRHSLVRTQSNSSPVQCSSLSEINMNMDFDFNPVDFQLCDGFGFYKFCSTGFGLDLYLTDLFRTSSQFWIVFRAVDFCIQSVCLLQWNFSHPLKWRITNYVPSWDKEWEPFYQFLLWAPAGTASDKAASSYFLC